MALILQRHAGGGRKAILRIGDNITVTVFGVKGNQVRLGIDAPRGTAIWREEIYQHLRAETPEGTPVEPKPLLSLHNSGGPREPKTL